MRVLQLSRPARHHRFQAAIGGGRAERLIQFWNQLFSLYNIHIGQMLLTRVDMEDRERFLNACVTLRADDNARPYLADGPVTCVARTEADYNYEWLSRDLNVKLVYGLDQAGNISIITAPSIPTLF